jgi:hypothetical protein
LSRAAYNRGGLGAGYSEGPWGGGPGTEAGWRRSWGGGPEGPSFDQGWERADYPRYGGEAREYPGYGGYTTQRGYPQRYGFGERGYGGSLEGQGYPPGGWGGGRAQEGSWAERGYGTRGFSGGFSGHDYDWTRRGERPSLQGGGWGGGFAGEPDWSSEFERGGRESGPHTGRGPRGYQRSDERVYEEVCERLTEHGALDASGIEVRCENLEVTLEGTVSDRWSKRLAEEIAESARGVRDVHNRLRVSGSERSPESTGRESSRAGSTRTSQQSASSRGSTETERTTSGTRHRT